jgi:Fic family protein
VDAGLADTAALRGWRQDRVGLHGWRYVPPNAKKVPDLIGGLERFAERGDLDPVMRALLVHLEFVTIHPFMDGNGRLGRLLMNHALLTAGLPWVTIRSDEPVPFFRSIEKAQVDDEVGPFVEFLWHLIRQVIREVGPRKVPRTRSAAVRRTASRGPRARG